MSEPVGYSIEEFVELFEGTSAPWVLWLGSAVSIAEPSGTPGTGPFLHGMVDSLTTPASRPSVDQLFSVTAHELGTHGRLDIAAQNRIQFEAAVGEVQLHTGWFVQRLIRALYPGADAARPNMSHLSAIALLADRVLGIVTTNFDECLEAAAAHIGQPVDVMVPSDGAFGTASPFLLKPHGSVSRPETVAVNPEQLRRRSADLPWRRSIARALNGLNVLFVGYSFRDYWDINPCLKDAAQAPGTRFYAAISPTMDIHEIRVPLVGFVRSDLSSPVTNILVRLSLSTRRQSEWPAPAESLPPDPRGLVSAAATEALRDEAVGVGRRLAALAALYYWMEDGRRSLGLFEAAAREDSAAVDGHLLARAYLRARRYRAAVDQFDRLLRAYDSARSVVNSDRAAAIRAMELCVGAGHCASAGGRRKLAARYYRRAIQELRAASITPRDLSPYLADQFLRSRAEWAIGAAERTRNPVDRERRLAFAARTLNELNQVSGLALTTRPLATLAVARIALMRGDTEKAASLSTEVLDLLRPWGDPHGVVVAERLRALAKQDWRALLATAMSTTRRSQWLEACKAIFDLGVMFTPAAGRPWLVRARDRLVAAWDLAKEFGHRASQAGLPAP